MGMMASVEVGRGRFGEVEAWEKEVGLGRSRKARYIWVVKRLGMLVGVTQRVKGMRDSVLKG